RLLPAGQQSISDQPQKQAGGKDRNGNVGLGLLEVMNEREQCDRVDDLMQPAPAQTSESAHHSVRRSGRERREPKPSKAADDEIDPVRYLVDNFSEVIALVGDIEHEVRGNVTEAADAEHAPYVD